MKAMWKSRPEASTSKKMAYQNTGSLSKNLKKELEKHPDMRGPANICCPNCGANNEYWLSGWFKTGRDSARFISLAFRDKQEKMATESGKQVIEKVFSKPDYDDIDF
jgi:hypothetical protein